MSKPKEKKQVPRPEPEPEQSDNKSGCEVCGQPYNYADTCLCGPCATGEAETIGEGVYTGD